MKEAVLFAQALADETRWRIASAIMDQAVCVCELVDGLRLAQSTLSSHLQVMRKGGLVTVEKCDKWAYYRIADSARALVKGMQAHFAETLALDATLAADRRRMLKRLALRGQTNCRGPRVPIPPAHPPRQKTACPC